MKKYLDPRAYQTFKKVFGEHKDLLISFLNALLPLPPGKEIVYLEYLTPKLGHESSVLRDSMMDVRCKDTAGRHFVVEMHMYWTETFMKHALLDTCKAYTRQTERGEKYDEPKSVYTLSLVNDIAFPEYPDEFYHELVPTYKNHANHIIDDFSMIFVELPKFKPQNVADKKMMVLWLRYLTEINEKTREVDAELLADPRLEKALSIVEESAYTEAEMWAIDKYWDMVSRERTAIYEADVRGRAEGLAEGMEKGMEKGRVEGRAEATRENALNLKRNGVPVELISKSLGLTMEEVDALG